MGRPVVEVSQYWGEELLDVRVFGADRREVSIGSTSARRWRFLGVDMGFVPAPLGAVLGAVPLGWSEVAAERRADFVVPDLDEDWRLVERSGDGWVVRAPGSGDGERVGEAPVVVRHGTFRFEVRAAEAERLTHRFRADLGSVGLAATVAAGLALVALGVAVAPPAQAVGVVERSPELIGVVLRAVPPSLPSSNKPTSPVGRPATRQESRERRPTQRMDRREIAEISGIFSGHDGSNEWVSSELPEGLSAAARSLVIGTVSGPGGEGLGPRGDLGGGEAEALTGFGPSGRGFGPGGPGGPGKEEGVLRSSPEERVTLGALRPDQIDEVVQRNLSQIRYCYQRELQRSPELAGKVSVRFTIARDGTVSAARASGSLESDAVTGCITRRFLQMRFPEPRGGGIVVVSYPFVFSRE